MILVKFLEKIGSLLLLLFVIFSCKGIQKKPQRQCYDIVGSSDVFTICSKGNFFLEVKQAIEQTEPRDAYYYVIFNFDSLDKINSWEIYEKPKLSPPTIIFNIIDSGINRSDLDVKFNNNIPYLMIVFNVENGEVKCATPFCE